MDYSTKTLAKGCFGKVYKEKYNESWAAMKKVPLGLISKEQLDRECRVYYSVNHPNVVKLLGDPFLKEGKWHIPLEFIFGEDLETTIFNVQRSKIQFSPAVKTIIITGMCEGLFYMHTKNIVHQDLKPDNIMIEHQTNRAVIIDMGLAKFSVNGLSSAQNLGNEAYSAPEILQRNGIRDQRSDVWAMGKIIAELIARIRLPTTSVSDLKIQETLRNNPYCNPVTRMVTSSPTMRTTMAGVIEEIRRAAKIWVPEVGALTRTKMYNPGLNPQGVGRGAAVAEATGKQKMHPPTYFPAEARVHEKPETVVHIQHSPPPARDALVAFGGPAQMGPKLPNMPCPLPADGTVVQRCYEENGQMEYKEIVMRKGKVVKYQDVKITKN